MKTLEYTILPGVGPGRHEQQGTVLDLLHAIPYCLSTFIPPLHVLNNTFAEGEKDAGMSGGCQWEPFQLTEAEYAELRTELQNRGFQEAAPPPWVETFEDWKIWELERTHGIPADEHKRLSNQCARLQEDMRSAQEQGRGKEAAGLWIKLLRAGRKLSRFVNRHAGMRRKTNGERS
jgi:hypothetical protein